jgi:subtilase family serine protease
MTLHGNVPAKARAEFDQGAASSGIEMRDVRLVLSRSAAQEAALEKFEAELQDKSSPNYHKWLTPEQFGKLYGPSDADIAAITNWLQSHGLKVEPVAPGRTTIAFSGSVSQIENALHTSIHSYQANGEAFLSNATNPSIPAALAPVISGVAQLNTIRPKPMNHRGNPGTADPQTKRLEPVPASPRARPDLTVPTGNSTSPYVLYMTPGDAATIYDTPNSFNAKFSSGTSYTGKGVTIGIGGDAAIQASTFQSYRKVFVGDSAAPTINSTGAVVAGADTPEAYIDTELSSGLAPGATISFYVDPNLFNAITNAINDNKVDIFSLSFGLCEQDLATADNAAINTLWQQAAAQGIAVTVSAGDTGSAGCDSVQTSTGANTTEATGGLGVSGYASTPYNIAVGGTDMDGLLTSFSNYVSTSYGSASTYYRTALSYIPEAVWNDSTNVDTTISANVPWTAVTGGSSYANISGGSGGASSCSTNTTVDSPYTVGTCTSGYGKPSWQRGTGVPSDAARDIPDVSLMSGDGFDLAAWLVCDDSTTKNSKNVSVATNCTTQTDGQFYFDGYGGTSTAAPAFAGILALVEEKTGGRLGQAAKQLYDLFNGANASSIYHDITVGNNAVPCTSGTPDCTKNSGGYYYESGYDTTAGYDLASGLGSVDASQLVSFWGTGVGPGTSSVALSPSATTINGKTDTLTVSVTVNGTTSLGTPTGTVTLAGGGYTSSAQALSSSGTTSFNIAPGTLSVGSASLAATYSGDANYGGSSASVTITVGPTYSMTASAPAAVTPGSQAMSTITVTGAAYSGSVTLSCALTTSPTGATHLPTCAFGSGGSSVTLSSTAASGTATAVVSTTAATAQLVRPSVHGWPGAAGGAVLALLVFLGIPARRRSWRALLGMLMLMAAIGSLSACGGGGGSSSGGGGTSNPGTTAGNYVFTVSGSPAVGSSTPSTTFTVTVN